MSSSTHHAACPLCPRCAGMTQSELVAMLRSKARKSGTQTSLYRGVSLLKQTGKWHAQINVGGKQVEPCCNGPEPCLMQQRHSSLKAPSTTHLCRCTWAFSALKSRLPEPMTEQPSTRGQGTAARSSQTLSWQTMPGSWICCIRYHRTNWWRPLQMSSTPPCLPAPQHGLARTGSCCISVVWWQPDPSPPVVHPYR